MFTFSVAPSARALTAPCDVHDEEVGHLQHFEPPSDLGGGSTSISHDRDKSSGQVRKPKPSKKDLANLVVITDADPDRIDVNDQRKKIKEHVGEIGDFLGKGAEGAIYEVTDKKSGKLKAVKFGTAPASAAREHRIASFLRDAYVKENGLNPDEPTHFLQTEIEPNSQALVMEHRPSTLKAILSRLGSSNESFSRTDAIAQQIVKLTMFMHRKNIIHLDLKPSNLLVNEADHDQVAINDFGATADLNSADPRERTTRIGTMGYNDPSQTSAGEAKPSYDLRGGLRETLTEIFAGATKDCATCGDFVLDHFPNHKRWIRSLHTRDSRVPETISAALWHRSNSDTEFLEIWDAAHTYLDNPNEFWAWYEKHVLEPLLASDPASALAEKEGSIEMQRAIEKKLISFSVPEGTRSQFSQSHWDAIPTMTSSGTPDASNVKPSPIADDKTEPSPTIRTRGN